MPNQSLLYTGRVLRLLAAAGDDAHRPRAVRRPDLRHARRGDVRRPRDRRRGWRSSTRSTSDWEAEDRRRLLAFARDLLNSDYAGHRLTFQLFAQSPPFAHLARRLPQLRLRRRRCDFVQRVGRAVRRAVLRSAEERTSMSAPPHPPVQHAATPIPSRSSTTTSARPSSPATRSTCAARSAQDLDTRESRSAIGDAGRRRPSRRWTTSSMLLEEAGARARGHRARSSST